MAHARSGVLILGISLPPRAHASVDGAMRFVPEGLIRSVRYPGSSALELLLRLAKLPVFEV